VTSAEDGWSAEVVQGSGPVPFLCFARRRHLVPELLADTREYLQRDCLVQGSRRITFGAMTGATARVARQLAARGLGPGDRLLLLAGNSPEWVITLWAALRLGAVPAPGNRWWSAAEVAYAADLVAPAVIVTDAAMAGRLPITAKASVLTVDEIRSWCDDDAPPPSLAAPPGDEDDPAVIIFTAGTTGPAKAAVLAHRSVIANLQNLLVLAGRLPGHRPGNRAGRGGEAIMQSGPLFHIGGLQSLLLAMLGGNTVVFLDGRFDPGQVLDLIERERITVWGAIPTMAIRVMEHPSAGRRDLSTVRSISLGGSPVTPELTDRLRAVFPSVRRGVSTVYGMTEAGGTVAAASGAVMADHPGTSGAALPVVELRIGAPDDGGAGEILVRSPAQMIGYWNDPAPGPIDADGWLHTGDLGRIEDGLLYVTGRAKDIIIRGGENIAAAHVEEILHRHPAVAAVAVVGLPDGDLGEIVAAIVQVRAPVTESELAAFAAGHLGHFEVPARWRLQAEELPMTEAGKIAKHELRAAWLSQDEVPGQIGSGSESGPITKDSR
jgi:long-chain acyl-CoA synthetase